MKDNLTYQKVNDELLVKYLTGQALPEEAILIDEWLAASASHREELQLLAEIWNISGDAAYQKPDVKESWTAFNKAIYQAPVYPIQQKPKRKLYLVAACAALVIGITSWLLLFSNRTTSLEEFVVVQSSQQIRRELLPDQTQIVLDQYSRLRYPAHFNGETRQVYLEGEGFFKVAHNPSRPFIIQLDGLQLKVVGTSFRIKNTTDNKIELNVATGKVLLYNQEDSLLVKAGETGIYYKEEKRFELIAAVDVNKYGYATQAFAFTDMPLADVFKHLEKTYGVKIHFSNTKIAFCRLSAQFDAQPLEEVLDVIAGTFNMTYTITGQKVTIEGKGCE